MAVTITTRIVARHDITENWDKAKGFVPLSGELIVYEDYLVDEEGNNIPNLKIGNGNAFVQDLPFIGVASSQEMLSHMSNDSIHVSGTDRVRWNNKLNVDDEAEVQEETLVFNRN